MEVCCFDLLRSGNEQHVGARAGAVASPHAAGACSTMGPAPKPPPWPRRSSTEQGGAITTKFSLFYCLLYDFFS